MKLTKEEQTYYFDDFKSGSTAQLTIVLRDGLLVQVLNNAGVTFSMLKSAVNQLSLLLASETP